MKFRIQLKRFSVQELNLFKYGMQGYSWRKSKRRDVYFLYPTKTTAKFEKIGIISLFYLSALNVSWGLFYRGIEFVSISVFLSCNVIAIWVCFGIYRRIAEIIDKLPSRPIAIADVTRGTFRVVNRDRLPFVQIPEDTLNIDIKHIDYCLQRSAYKIYNGKTGIWNYWSYGPTWSALYICFREKDDKEELQLLFAGERIPSKVISLFTSVLHIETRSQSSYSRFD